MRSVWILFTIFTGLSGLSIHFYYTVSRKLAEGFSLVYSVVHYFSFFTIIMNTILTILLVSYFLNPNSRLSFWFKKPQNSAGIANYILIVGTVYYALLFNPEKPFSAEVLASHLLHSVMPLSYLILWYRELRGASIKYIQAVRWLLFPLVYFSYVLIRGLIVQKYPYFFIDVVKYGYGPVILNAAVVMVFFLIIGLGLITFDRRFQRTK